MTVAVAPVAAVPGPQYSQGILKSITVDITFDNSYVTAGEPLDIVGVLGFSTVVYAPPAFAVTASRTTSVMVHFDPSPTNKLVVYWGNAGTAGVLPEVTSTTDLSTFTVRMTFFGY